MSVFQERQVSHLTLVEPMTETTGPTRPRREKQRVTTGESEEDGDVSSGNRKRMGGEEESEGRGQHRKRKGVEKSNKGWVKCEV